MSVFKLRESRPVGQVILFKDDVQIFRSDDYSTTAKYAQSRFSLSDGELMSMYYEYREDYDSI